MLNTPHFHMFIFAILLSYSCNSEIQSRNFMFNESCDIDYAIDFKLTNDGSDVSSEVDLTVINALRLATRDQQGCHYSIFDVQSSGTVKNAYIVVNATIDMTNISTDLCDEVSVVPFPDVFGVMDNVTLTGWINLTNVNNTLIPLIKFSKFFGITSASNANNTYSDI